MVWSMGKVRIRIRIRVRVRIRVRMLNSFINQIVSKTHLSDDILAHHLSQGPLVHEALQKVIHFFVDVQEFDLPVNSGTQSIVNKR